MFKINLPFLSRSHGFDLDSLARELFVLMRDDPLQRRVGMVRNEQLDAVAKKRATDMSVRDYFSHVDPEGRGPNWHVMDGGYALPDWYGSEPHANNIESIGGGFSSAGDFWVSLKRVPGHRMHVLAEHEMFAQQKNVGIGCVYDARSTYRPIWVILTCP